MALYELRKIALGEFFDDVEVGDWIANIFGMVGYERKNSTDESTSEEDRLGYGDILSIFGPTFIICALLFITLIAVLIAVFIIRKRVNCSEKCGKCFKWLSEKIFFNPIIRYVLLSTVKLQMASLIVFKAASTTDIGTTIDIVAAILILFLVSLSFLLFVLVLRHLNKELNVEQIVKRIGSLYAGKNVKLENHRTH